MAEEWEEEEGKKNLGRSGSFEEWEDFEEWEEEDFEEWEEKSFDVLEF